MVNQITGAHGEYQPSHLKELIQPEIDFSPGYDAQCSYCTNYGYTSRMDEYGNVTRHCVECIKSGSIRARADILKIQEEMLDRIFGRAEKVWGAHDRNTCNHGCKES